MMASQPIHYWTFIGLVGAFLDLIIAYFLLCASTCIFFASKFVGLFGFSLPSPCNGLFGIPNSSYSLQTLLADCSMEKVSSVQSSIKTSLPFDSGSVLGRDHNYNVDYNVLKLDRDGNSAINVVELEGDGSSGSGVDGRKEVQNGVKKDVVTPRSEKGIGKERKFDVKGKGVMNQKLSGGLRRRRKLSPLVGNQHKAPQFHREQSDKVDNNLEHVGIASSKFEMEASRNMKVGDRDSGGFGLNLNLNYGNGERISSVVPESRNDEKTTVRVLEQALEEEHAARAALYLELEEERSAAASAADEAMAMILRLQEEKASIEMEARQYQRMIEEKSAYDAEEMNILKEILLRRETEKHFLEKEVEAYRQMFYQPSDSEGEMRDPQDIQRENFVSQYDLTEDPDMMLHKLNDSVNNKNPRTEGSSTEFTESNEPKEKEMISHLKAPICGSSQEENWAEKTIPIVDNEQKINDEFVLHQKMGIKTNETGSLTGENSQNMGNHENDVSERVENPRSLMSDEDSDVLDIHIIDDDTMLSDSSKNNRTRDVPRESFLIQRNNSERGYPSASRSDYETDSNKSTSDINIEQLGMGPSRRPPVVPDMRRNSMTALDSERTKMDTEVEWLRERLRVVQQGREKLKVSKENPERERLQLQLLENIACQLREIQQLTEPGKALRHQGSLPPSSSKVKSKKRRCRSVSIELGKRP